MPSNVTALLVADGFEAIVTRTQFAGSRLVVFKVVTVDWVVLVSVEVVLLFIVDVEFVSVSCPIAKAVLFDIFVVMELFGVSALLTVPVTA